MLAVTGANGHLGLRLLREQVRLPREQAGHGVRALVRSPDAADQVKALGLGDAVDVRIVDYGSANDLAEALGGCTAVVHLVGIIKESRASRYRNAHEGTCTAIAEAAHRAGLGRIVYLSILGASVGSGNACLASKGAAERTLRDGAVPVTVIRLPMVLGEGDFASRALSERARRGRNLVLRGSSLDQPIYAGDVAAAVLVAATESGTVEAYELAGPESLTRTALIHRAAGLLGRRTRVLSLPLAVGLSVAWVLEHVSADPPVTRAMLGVLDHDDRIDPAPAAAALRLTLTPLDETLRRCIGGATAS
jgi:NADH dehydrogenase